MIKATQIVLSKDDPNEKCYKKGIEFERHIVDLFKPQNIFAINDWTRDIYNKQKGIKVESNSNPDLIIRHKPTNTLFAIECKYRSNFYFDYKIGAYSIEWSTYDQIRRYNTYSKTNNMPVYIVIGIGKTPHNPERMYCLPLKEAIYPILYPSIYEKYKRNPNKCFYWNNGILK